MIAGIFGLMKSDNSGGNSSYQLVLKTADVVVDGLSSVFVSDPELTFAFEADSLYELEFNLMGTVTKTSGLKTIFDADVVARMLDVTSMLWNDSENDMNYDGLNTILAGGHQGFIDPNIVHRLVYRGFLFTTRAGTLVVQFAPEVDKEEHISAKDSWIKITKLR